MGQAEEQGEQTKQLHFRIARTCSFTSILLFVLYNETGRKIRDPARSCKMPTSSTAQGGGGSFKNRKPIREIACCKSPMAGQKH